MANGVPTVGDLPFKRGDRVFLRSAGIGTIADLAGKDSQGRPAPLGPGMSPSYYVVDLAESLAFVPIHDAAKTLRNVCDRETAESMLAILRGPDASLPSQESLLDRGKRVVHEGSGVDQARLLREFYELPAPLNPALSSGLAFLQGLVLPEVALALGLSLPELEGEMRTKYAPARDAEHASKAVAWMVPRA